MVLNNYDAATVTTGNMTTADAYTIKSNYATT